MSDFNNRLKNFDKNCIKLTTVSQEKPYERIEYTGLRPIILKLAEFLKIPNTTKMSFEDVRQKINEYILKNSLYEPANKSIKYDFALSQLFDLEDDSAIQYFDLYVLIESLFEKEAKH